MRKRELIAEYRATKKAADEQNYAEGAAAGREWATSDPVPYTELRNIAGHRQTLVNFGYEDRDLVSSVILGYSLDEVDNLASSEFWWSTLGDGWLTLIDDPQFLRGFCEGALQVWAEVESHLV